MNMGCDDCRRKRQPTPPQIVVTIKKPATSLLAYVTGLALGYALARAVFDLPVVGENRNDARAAQPR